MIMDEALALFLKETLKLSRICFNQFPPKLSAHAKGSFQSVASVAYLEVAVPQSR
jgi:hypothetical protein